MRLSHREAREVRSDRVNDFADRKARDELIGQLLDKGHDLRVEGESEKAGICFDAAGELVRTGR
jgi:hypothetical protein